MASAQPLNVEVKVMAWKSVEEILPTKAGRYWVTLQDREILGTLCCSYDRRSGWHDFEWPWQRPGRSLDGYMPYVSHWMELPDPVSKLS